MRNLATGYPTFSRFERPAELWRAAVASALSIVGSPHLITATYSGNAFFTGSVNSPAFAQTVNQMPTKTTLATSPTVWATDRPTTFTAVVTLLAGAGSLTTGTSLKFIDNGSPLGTGTLSSSTATTATYTYTTTLSAGPHSINAAYTGTSNIASSASATQSQTVHKFSSLVFSGPASAVVGTAVVYTATFTGLGGIPIANASINFTIGGSTFTVQTNAKGVAAISHTFTTAGTFAITASFASDGIFNDALASLTTIAKQGTGRVR